MSSLLLTFHLHSRTSSRSLSISTFSLRFLSISSCCLRSHTWRWSSEMTALLLLLLLTTTSSVDANPIPSSDEDDSVSLHRFLDGKDVGERRDEEMLLLLMLWHRRPGSTPVSTCSRWRLSAMSCCLSRIRELMNSAAYLRIAAWNTVHLDSFTAALLWVSS